MKKQDAGAERILGRRLARELRGEDLARTMQGGISDPQLPLQPIKTTTASYPSDTITDGYVAAVSRHSRGDTVDLTLVELPVRPMPPFNRDAAYGPCTGPARERAPDASVDMGTGYDCFDPLSHTAATGLTETQARWRKTLVEAMAREGFHNYRKEWWHFTLATARAPRAFDVPIVPRER